jgi:hypothetical protein
MPEDLTVEAKGGKKRLATLSVDPRIGSTAVGPGQRFRCTRPGNRSSRSAGLNRAYMGGVERGQRNVGVVNLRRIADALDMSLSELFAEIESEKERDEI